MPPSDLLLEIDDLHLAYGANEVVHGLSFSLARGTIGCLLGPSGCGKTTVLRCIAGFEPPRRGEVRLNGERVSAPGRIVPPERRRIGMVFQDFALFPHLSVAQNIAFGLRSWPAPARSARVRELAELVRLGASVEQYPHELSGGQQQRVALARALAPRPDLLLLDEPFSNLDVELREQLSVEVRDIIKASGATAVLVTHDQQEAFAMADEIGVMNEGCIAQWDTPYALYHEPVNRFVADFVGQGVFLPARVLNAHRVEIELGVLDGDVPAACQQGCDNCGRGCMADVLLRPDDIVHDDASSMKAEVVKKAFRGADILYTLRLESGRTVLALVPSHHNHAIGERIGIRLDVDHVVAFAPLATAATG
ncbi:MAG TPA: ABC transporter ATP-binding protein [Burkholderiales bacterium]|nr:ABC transporter ATP-binding protein [Burkholderiales bacterium]